MNLKLKTGIVLLAALNLIQPAPTSAEIAATHVYHNHMPNFWPFYAVDIGAKYNSTPVGGPIRYTYDGEVINLKQNPPPGYSYYLPGDGIMPHDDLVAYYSHNAKTGAYLDWPWQVAGDMNSNANTGQVHVTMSGAVVNNVQSLVSLNNVPGYDRPNWGGPWRNAYNTLKTPHGYRTLDLIHFTGHHSMGPLVGPDYFLKDLIYHNATLAQDYFLDGSFKSSSGFFPTELGFSERLIPTLAKLGVKWSVLGNNHLSRTLQDYPFDVYYPNKDTMISPPNRADLQNVSQVGAWVNQPMAHEQQQIANKYPFASTPHWVRYVDPATGREDRLIGIPVDQAGSWLEGWEGQAKVSDVGLQNFEGLVPQKQFFVIAHDGDNSSGRAGSQDTWLNGRGVTCTEGVKCIGIDEYLSANTPPASDIVHVQDGSWVDTRDSSADPQWDHWHLPFGIWQGQFAEFNRVTGLNLKPKTNLDGLTEGMTVSFEQGFHYLERNFALLQAALNYARTAEQIWLDSHPNYWQPSTAMDREITYPGNQLNPWMISFPVKGDPNKDYKGGANPAELAWYFLLPAMDSGFGYYDENKDDHVKGTLAFNNSLYFAKPYVQANLAGDRTGPSVWWPQRWPYNPGSVNADKSEGWTVHHFDHHFAIYTYAYDVAGISAIKARIRPHKDKVIATTDNTFRVYDPVALKAAGVPNIDPAQVGDWKDYPLTRRDLKPVMNGVAWNKANMDTMAVLPAQEIGDLYYAYIGDYRDQIVDYYIEATDSKGNVTRSEIQQVYVGAGRYNKVGDRYIEAADGGIVGTYPFLDTVPPTAPGKPAVTKRTECGLTLAWAASTDNVGVAGYELYRNGASVGTTAATSYTDSGFKPQTTYAYAVLAYDTAGNKSGLSEALPVTDPPVDTTPPGAPGQPVASNVTASAAVLSWPAANDDCGVAQYEVQRNGVRTGITATATYTDSTLAPATTYAYQVIAVDAAGNPSAPSPAIELKTVPANTATVYYFRKDWSKVCIHYAPTGGSWTTPPGVAMEQACPNWWVKPIILGSATTMAAAFNNCTGVWDNNSGRNYSLKTDISAVQNGQVTVGVNPCQGGDDTTPPSVPTGLKASEVTSTALKLCWNASTDDKSGVKDYRVLREGSQAVVTETCFTDSGLTPDTTYHYTVKAGDKAGNSSAESEPLSVRTEREEGNKVTVYYRPGFPTTCFHYRPEGGNWSPPPGRPMEKSTDFSGYNQITVDIGGATRLEAAFNNCKDQWDSNNGQNYRFDQGAWTYDAACSPRIATGVPRPGSAAGVTFNVNATTVRGQNVYVVGDMAELGGWDTAKAKSLSVTTSPIWSATLTLPASKSFQYKYIKKDETAKVLWESGDNRTATTSSSCSQILNDTWR